MLEFRQKNSLFCNLMNNLVSYLTETKAFEYNEIDFDINYIVETDNLVNINKNGNYFIYSNNKIFSVSDKTKEEVYTCVYKDKFTCNDIDFFINEKDEYREIGVKWNNSLIGSCGIYIRFGDLLDGVKYNAPSAHIVYKKESNLSPLEKTFVTLEKQLEFDIFFMLNDTNAQDPNIDYNVWEYYTEKLVELIYSYFNSVDCKIFNITDWRYEKDLIVQQKNELQGILSNKLIYI